MKKNYFPEDRYDTPDDTPRAMGDRLLLNSRWWFYCKFMGIILKSRRYAVKGIYDDNLWAETSFEVFQRIEQAGGRFHIKGINNLRQNDEPLVLISNHMSTLETIIFPCIIVPFRPVTFVVKHELVKARVFGPIMRSRNPIVVGRKDPRRDLRAVMNGGQETLEKGISIVIFPQSTRQARFDPEKFNTLGVKLAGRAGVEVLPVAIKTDFWGNGKYIKDLGPLDRTKPIHMVFGEPLSVTGNGNQQHRQIIEFIESHLDRWGSDGSR